MVKSIDLKSLLIGGLLVLMVLSCLGAVPWLSQERFGRFTVGATDEGAFILDTATGQAWAFVHPAGSQGGSFPHPEDFFAPKLDVEVLYPAQ